MNTLKMVNFTVCVLFQALKKYLALKITCLFDIEVQLGRHPVYCLVRITNKRDSEMGHLKGSLCPEATVLGLGFCPFISRNKEGGDRKWDPVP